MLIPHFDSHGKMNGDPLFIKGEVVPLIPWATVSVIRQSLAQISEKTNVKHFLHGGRWYLHATNWQEHQYIREDRTGTDLLPSYSGLNPEPVGSSPGVVLGKSGSSPGLVPLEVEVRSRSRSLNIEGEGGEVPPGEGSPGGERKAGPPPGGDNGIDITQLVPKLRPCPVIREAVKGMTDEVYFTWVRFAYNYIIDHEKVRDWETAYPKVDIFHELNKASEWLLEHPHQRRSHAFQFYGNWVQNASTPKSERRRTG